MRFTSDTKAFDYESQGLIHEMFMRQACKAPDKLAVVSPGENKQMTYRELEEASEILATSLQKRGVKEDCIVAIYIERCLDLVIAAIATLRAGT